MFDRGPTESREEVLGAIYQDKRQSMLRYAITVGADRTLAEDCVQDIFAKLLRSSIPVERLSSAYLRQAVRHEYLRAIMRTGRFETLPAFLPDDKVPEHGYEDYEDTLTSLLHVLAPLPRRCQQIVHARARGRTYAEIATHFGVSVKTVSAQIEHAKRIIRGRMESEESLIEGAKRSPRRKSRRRYHPPRIEELWP